MEFDTWLARVKELNILEKVVDQLEVDQQKGMPSGGAKYRAYELGALKALHHERFVDPAFREATELLFARIGTLTPEQAVCVQVTHRRLQRKVATPIKLVRALGEAESAATAAWGKAREGEGDFSLFAGPFQQLVDTAREHASASTSQDAYDWIIGRFEPGLTGQRTLELCQGYTASSRSLLQRVMATPVPDASILDLPFPRQEIVAFCRGIGRRMGIDPNRIAYDVTKHPCTVGINPGDVRVYGWREEKDAEEDLTAGIHEDGHALHRQGFLGEWAHTPMADSTSFGVNESQSTLWERIIGGSREFWLFYFPFLQERLPDLLAGRTSEEMYRAFNRVRPGPIRIGADTLTYIAHILIRVKIESALFSGALSANDTPEMWREEYRSILGVAPPNDAKGCLQDGHWAWGYFGYFPSYAIGLMMAAQLAEHLERTIGLWGLVASGTFAPITHWLRTHIHQHGDRYMAEEMVLHATGSPLSPDALVRILQDRLADVYHFTPALSS